MLWSKFEYKLFEVSDISVSSSIDSQALQYYNRGSNSQFLTTFFKHLIKVPPKQGELTLYNVKFDSDHAALIHQSLCSHDFFSLVFYYCQFTSLFLDSFLKRIKSLSTLKQLHMRYVNFIDSSAVRSLDAIGYSSLEEFHLSQKFQKKTDPLSNS